MKSAKGGKPKTQFLVEVSEKTILLPSTLEKGIPSQFPLNGVVMEATGTLSKDGEVVLFTARGNGQKFKVAPNEDVTKIIAAGKSNVVLTGKVSEDAPDKDGKKPLPAIAATAAVEVKEAK